MLIVQKDNKQLKIADENKDMYLSLGYSLINEKGQIVEAGHATSLAEIKAENATLRSKYSELLKENEVLKAENDTLKAENEELKVKKTK